MKKEKMEIIWTKEYEQFSLFMYNRKIDKNHVNNKIKKSLLQNGWLKSNPMIVDENFNILDGQHRFLAAKELGIEIPVLIQPDFKVNEMITVNNASKTWTDIDYLRYRATTGELNARKLLQLVDKYKISVRIALQATSSYHTAPMVDMEFKPFSQLEAEIVLDKVFDICKIVECRTTRLLAALLYIVKDEEYEHEKMLRKLKKQIDRYHYCNSREAYIELFENIYNYNNSHKVYFAKRYK